MQTYYVTVNGKIVREYVTRKEAEAEKKSLCELLNARYPGKTFVVQVERD